MILRFVAGFVTASVLWGGLSFLYMRGMLGELGPAQAECAPAPAKASEQAPDPKKKRRSKRHAKRAGDGTKYAAEAQTGDDLDWEGARDLDMNAGEQQLSGAQIETGFDNAMAQIRRCLMLVPAEGDIKGQLLFGMRVGSDGKPKAVNLTGPGVVTEGESGACLRNAAASIRFASFDGPDALFKYPITLQ